jgi:CheY-like chemotaxis protein
VTLRRRDGVSKNFTALSLRPPLEDENGLPTIAGAITDRSLEEQNIRLRQECAHMHRHNQDLALFFAAVCRQVQSHLFPYILNGIRGPGTPPRAAFDRKANGAAESGLPGGEGAGEGVQPDAAESPRGQEQIIRAHQSAFEDIYRISLAEAENSFPAPAPMDFMQILEEVFLQVLPLLHEQGTALFCEVDRNIDPRVYGFDLILRHTLVRALLNVAGPMRGGRAFLGLALAPNALPYDSSGKIQFTLSWDAGPLPDTGRPGAPGAEAPPPDVLESNPTGFSQREEHDILRFLVDKMQGELLPPAFSASARSICFLVRFGLEAMPSFSSLAEPLPGAKANLSPDAEGDPFSPATASVPPPATAGIAAPEEDLFPPETGDADHPSLASLAGLPGLLAPDSPQSLDLLPSSPVADAAEAPLDILIPDEQTVGPETVQDDSLNLLLIDANLNDRLLFSSCLRGTRHRVTEAHDGLQGVEAFQNQDFDVIFMDMEMPLMDGYQATRVIRALEADVGRRLTPIVAFTPQILPEFKYQCMLAGCTDFLLKPFNQASLLAMIHGFSREKRALSLPERETS